MRKARVRPILRYHGGKFRIAKWIIEKFPEHRIYAEPFGGAGSILLRKKRSYAEVYNDLDDEIVNVFKVVRDHGRALQRRLKMTPFARTEYVDAKKPTKDPVERAARTIIKSFMGFGSDSIRGDSGFRANAWRQYTIPAHDWVHYAEAMPFFIARMQGVVIENRPASTIIKQHDTPDTFFYVDPPYLHETRTSSKRYKFEMTEADHIQLALQLNRVKGKVLISCYDSPLYRRLYKPSKWKVYKRRALADGARERQEVLYANY